MYLDTKDQLFCEAAIALNLLSNEQIQNAISQQKVDRAIGNVKPIGAYLFESNVLTKEQIAQIVSYQESHHVNDSESQNVAREDAADTSLNANESASKDDARGCGCASFLIAMLIFYLSGWRVIFGQPDLTIASILFEIGSKDFVCSGNAILFKYNGLFYGLYLIPRFFDSYFVSWLMLFIGFKVAIAGEEMENKNSDDK